MDAATYSLELARMISSKCIGYIEKFVTVLVISVGISLLVRYLKLRFSPRVEPSPKKSIVITDTTSGIEMDVAKRFYKTSRIKATRYLLRTLLILHLEDCSRSLAVALVVLGLLIQNRL